MHRQSVVVVLALAAAMMASPAWAQNPPPPQPSGSPRHLVHVPMFMPHGEFGAPLALSGGLGVFFELADDGELVRGLIAEGGVGQGGYRGAFGYQSFIEYIGLDVRATVHRTWSSPRGASADSTYVGGEIGLTIAFVRFSIGGAHRIAGAGGEKANIKTWTAGLVIPIWR